MVQVEQVKVSTEHIKNLVRVHCKKSVINDQVIIRDEYDLFYIEIILFYDGKKATIINLAAYTSDMLGDAVEIINDFDYKQEDIKL